MGIFVYGSAVGTKGTRAPKDIDVISVNSGATPKNESFLCDEDLVEHFAYVFDNAVRGVVAYRSPLLVKNMASGVLLNPEASDPKLINLKCVSESNLRKGPPQIGKFGHIIMRIKYETVCRELRVPGLQEEARAFLHAWTTNQVIGDFYHFYGLYLPKWSYLMDYLQERDLEMHTLVTKYLSSEDLDDRDQKLFAIIDHHLKPFGGFPSAEWVATIGTERLKEKKSEDSEWSEWDLPLRSEIQPDKDAYKIGYLAEFARGQDLPPLGKGFELGAEPRCWWDDAKNETFPDIDEALKEMAYRYSEKPDVTGILLVGSYASRTPRRIPM
ncbi:MAG: hypothetical protein JKX97_04530 [Candidatus Lindowbacteria bacterium]|nr:hypothetical protein [Candidatus Lindowbacteria bacterium]